MIRFGAAKTWPGAIGTLTVSRGKLAIDTFPVPGSTDATMIGVSQAETRELLEQGLALGRGQVEAAGLVVGEDGLDDTCRLVDHLDQVAIGQPYQQAVPRRVAQQGT